MRNIISIISTLVCITLGTIGGTVAGLALLGTDTPAMALVALVGGCLGHALGVWVGEWVEHTPIGAPQAAWAFLVLSAVGLTITFGWIAYQVVCEYMANSSGSLLEGTLFVVTIGILIFVVVGAWAAVKADA